MSIELVETHAHLDYGVFQDDFLEVLKRAEQAGVRHIITIGTGVESSRAAVKLAEEYEQIYAAVGVHPLHAEEELRLGMVEEIESLAKHRKVVAIGEIGLDYFRLPGGPNYQEGEGLERGEREKRARIIQKQKEVFLELMGVARRVGKNVVVHQRAAWSDVMEVLREHAVGVKCVMHCFSGSLVQAREVISLGHYVSFTGIVTFKNGAVVRDCATGLKRGDFFLETDCPYLAPEPYRGKRCEPAHTRLVAEAIAQARGEKLEEVAVYTTEAAIQFFGLKDQK
ncbi:MAG: TatD family hydrolase [Chthoniobacterales bacterium]|nr:TatD family hydrolase [Chthoniobacterales bacterium]